MTNPYRPPATKAETDPPQQHSVARLMFFLVNFAVAVLLFLSSVIAIATMESPGSFLGGLFCLFPVLIYGTCEWIAFYRRNVSVERMLGYANLGCAAFVAFGTVTTIGESVFDRSSGNIEIVCVAALIGGGVFAYLVASGWCRLRWTRRPPGR